MSRPVDTIDRLLKLGALVSDQFNNESETSELTEFLESDEYETIKEQVDELLSGLTDEGIAETIEHITKKRRELLAGRKLTELQNDQMVQYMQLGNARSALVTKQVKVAADADFLHWASEKALPALLKAAPAIIALLA